MLTAGRTGTNGTLKLRACWVVGWRAKMIRKNTRAMRMMASVAWRAGLVERISMPQMRMGTRLMQRTTMIRINLNGKEKRGIGRLKTETRIRNFPEVQNLLEKRLAVRLLRICSVLGSQPHEANENDLFIRRGAIKPGSYPTP